MKSAGPALFFLSQSPDYNYTPFYPDSPTHYRIYTDPGGYEGVGPNAIQIFALSGCVLPRCSSSNKSMESRNYKELRQRDQSIVLQDRHIETSLVNQSDLGKPKQHSKLTARGFQIYRIISCSFDLIKSGNSFNYLIVGRGQSDIPKSGEIFVCLARNRRSGYFHIRKDRERVYHQAWNGHHLSELMDDLNFENSKVNDNR